MAVTDLRIAGEVTTRIGTEIIVDAIALLSVWPVGEIMRGTGNLAFVGIVLMLGGCTKTLQITPVVPLAGADVSSLQGAPWPLYMDRFSIAAKYALTSCKPMALEIETDVTTESVPDPEHTYIIDPTSMSGLFKTSKFETTYHPDGLPATINAEADDRTGEAIAGLLKTAAGIAKIAAAGAGLGNRSFDCAADIQIEFDKVEAQQKVVEAAKTSLEVAEIEFNSWKARIDATSGAVAPETQTGFNNAYRSLAVAKDRLESAKKALDKLRKPFSITETFLWPDKGDERSKGLDPPAALSAALKKWSGDADIRVSPADYALDVKLAVPTTSPFADPVGQAQLNKAKLLRGIPYRMPSPAKLTVVWTQAPSESGAPKAQTLWDKTYALKQFGRVMQLPCISRPFTAITCALAFNDKGQLTKVAAASTKAPGEAIATMFVSGVESASSAAEAIRARDERQRTADTKRKQEELAEQELDVKLKAARDTLNPAQPSAQKATEAAILRYETDLKLRQVTRALEEDIGKYNP